MTFYSWGLQVYGSSDLHHISVCPFSQTPCYLRAINYYLEFVKTAHRAPVLIKVLTLSNPPACLEEHPAAWCLCRLWKLQQ